MGHGSFDKRSYDTYSAATTTNIRTGKRLGATEIFTSNRVHKDLDPKKVTIRESCDSDDNPVTTPIIIALDVTGSMGYIAVEMLNNQLGKLMEGIHNCPFITHPHIMFMAVGDYDNDQTPLQVTQFEADLRIAEQLKQVYNEGGGGGNSCESYHLPWYFAAHHCKCDAITKRGKKGFLFTIGDEEVPTTLSAKHINAIMETASLQKDVTTKELYASVKENWEVFHLIIQEGSHYRYHGPKVDKVWRGIIGNRALKISDFNYVADVVVAAFDIVNGTRPESIIDGIEDKHKRSVFENAFVPSKTVEAFEV